MPRCACTVSPLVCLLLSIPCAIAQTAPQGASPVATIQAGTQLVVVDVVATDSKQNAVHGLKASDFTVLENGSAQQVIGFEEHSAPSAAELAKAPGALHLPPGIFANFTPSRAGSAVNILLLDALNTPMKAQMYVRDQLLDFVRKADPGTRIAIFALNSRLVMLQGFTSDLTLLKQVMEKTKPGASFVLSDVVGNGNNDSVADAMTQVSGGGGDMGRLIESVQQLESTQASNDSQVRAHLTLDAMNQLSHYLAGIPGRKNLVWFSGSFPLNVFPDGSITNPSATVGDSEAEFRETTNLLTRSQVAVYTVDARGLQTDAGLAVASGQGGIGKQVTRPGEMSRGAVLSASARAFETNANEHMTLSSMAADSGGQTYLDDNGLASAVSKAINNGANYYTLTYRPSDQRQNGEFRKIQVKLDRAGIALAHRNGYYAADAKRPAASANSPMQPTSFVKAMLRGAPEATEIMMKLQVAPATAGTETTLAKNNLFSPEPAAKKLAKGPFRRYVIDVAADGHDIQITPTGDGRYAFEVEMRTFVYDGSGQVVDVAMEKERGNLTPSSLANMLHVGLPFRQEVSVPATGEYYLRTSL
ncbi:MAG TPA: VWA domain-containing protein, partial [Acidobacteriaceae bacterium]|nr:VWA domain-containing protein [Acidobacteriaceae bacterium]